MDDFYQLNEFRKLAMGQKSYEKAVAQFDEKYIVKNYLDLVNEIIETMKISKIKTINPTLSESK